MTVYGLEDTMRAFEAGSLETLLIYEATEDMRLSLRNKDTDSITVIYCKPDQMKNPKFYKEGIHDLELVEAVPINEWATEHYTEFGCNLEFITDKSPEGF